MLDFLVGGIRRIGIFIICAQVLVQFRPDGSYEKYLKMLVSIMILLQILQPVSGLLNGEEGRNLWERVMWFEKQLNEITAAADESRERAERLRERMSLEEVQKRLREADEGAGGKGVQPAGDGIGEAGPEDIGIGDIGIGEVGIGESGIAPVEEIRIGPEEEPWSREPDSGKQE